MPKPDAGGTGPSPGSLAALAALGFVQALWSQFLWAQLVLTRSGGTAFCAFGDTGACAKAWDGAFASAVHRLTGVPLAGWGLVWGVLAFVLPLLLFARLGRVSTLVSATRITAAAGVLSVFALLAVSLAEKALCGSCFVSYLVVAGYAGIALLGWPGGLSDVPRGAAVAALGTLGVYAVLLYPGVHTPRRAAEAGRAAVADTTARPQSVAMGPLADFVAQLSPPLQQTLADSLGIYRRSATLTLPPPRVVLGPAQAPITITEWTDVLCDHCAELHETLQTLGEHLPPGSFNVVPRQFPLDGACNPLFQAQNPGPSVRCLGAQMRACLEGQPGSAELTAALFENQKRLTASNIWEFAKPLTDVDALRACVASDQTRSRLETDIRAAASFDPDGTPIVAINGRQGTSFAPFLYAIILARGNADDPAFAGLPPANPAAHLH